VADHDKERKALTIRAESAETALKAAQAALENLKSQFEEAESKAKSIQGELDDLLLVLGEMEEKHARYKQKVKSLNGQLTDDEEDEEE
jgi:intracellular protein transport protein USO1